MRYLYLLTASLSLALALPISDIGTQEPEKGNLQLRGVRGGGSEPHNEWDSPVVNPGDPVPRPRDGDIQLLDGSRNPVSKRGS